MDNSVCTSCISCPKRQYILTTRKLLDVIAYYCWGIFKGRPHPVQKSPGAKHNPLQRLTYLGLSAALLPVQMATGLLYWCYNDWPAWMGAAGGLSLVALLSAILLVPAFCAASGEAPAVAGEKPGWLFHFIVDVDFVKQYAKMPKPDGVMIIDSRPKKAKYDKGHIPSAISIPDTKFDDLKGKLPVDKENLLVFYCGGFKCKLSHKSAAKAIDPR